MKTIVVYASKYGSTRGIAEFIAEKLRQQRMQADVQEVGQVHNLFAAYLCTVPLEELIERVERARLDAQLRYVVIYGTACSYCLGRAERLEGSYLRTFALELKEQLAQTLTAFVTSILAGPGRLDAEGTKEPPLRQITDVLQHVMCTHDAEKLAIPVLEVYRGGCRGERSSK